MEKCTLFIEASSSPQAQYDYEIDLNRRTTEQVYSHYGVAPFDFSKHSGFFFQINVAVAGLRRFSRFIMPDTMEWAVARDHPEVKERLRKEDALACTADFSLDYSFLDQFFEKGIETYYGQVCEDDRGRVNESRPMAPRSGGGGGSRW